MACRKLHRVDSSIAARGRVKVIDMLTQKKYSDFDFKPLKIPKLQFWRLFPKNFLEDPKKNKIRILYPKKYDEHTYHFTMEVPPPPGSYVYGRISLASRLTGFNW